MSLLGKRAPWTRALVLLATVAGLAVCSSGVAATHPEPEAIERAVEAPLKGYASRNAQQLCGSFTRRAAERLLVHTHDCAAGFSRAFALLRADGKDATKVAIPSRLRMRISQTGNVATVLTTWPWHGPAKVRLEKQGGRWLISNAPKLVKREGCVLFGGGPSISELTEAERAAECKTFALEIVF